MSNNLDDLYCFVTKKDAGEDERSFIKVLKGPLKECIVKINSIRFADEENPDGTLNMEIDYDWVYKPSGKKFGQKKIMNTLGPIVVDILDQDFKGFAEAAGLGE
jgi:hypothetical protein